jgi:hypothetical protein
MKKAFFLLVAKISSFIFVAKISFFKIVVKISSFTSEANYPTSYF